MNDHGKQNETVLGNTLGMCAKIFELYCGSEMVDFQRLTKYAGWWNHSDKCA